MPEPENRETPLDEVQTWVTPNRLFFVRNHFDRPEIDLPAWRLLIGGLVDRPTKLTWDEVQSLPQRSLFATLECAGNGRSFLKEPVTGVQWGAGAVGHAEWTGVPLRDLLIRAGLSDDTVEVVFTGADTGTEKDHPEQVSPTIPSRSSSRAPTPAPRKTIPSQCTSPGGCRSRRPSTPTRSSSRG